ncbi:MAG: OmpA family protein [Planctomycetota bacterium]
MISYRHLYIGAALCLLVAGGCARRDDVAVAELQSDNERLTRELAELHRQSAQLERQRNEARNELVKLREQKEGLEQQLRKTLAEDTWGPDIEIIPGGKGLRLGDDFLFATGSADLTAEGQSAIAEIAAKLRSEEYADTIIVVEGHTDSTPVTRPATVKQFRDNWGLSAMRSAAVVRALKSAGLPAERLHGAFRGDHEPIPDAPKDKNRRVEIYVSLRQE